MTTPANMPSEITVDITNMKPGDVIRLGTIVLPKGTRALGDPDLAIVTAIAGSKAEVATAAPAAAEVAPAAGDDKAKS